MVASQWNFPNVSSTSFRPQLRTVFFSSVGSGPAHISSLDSPCKVLVKDITTWQTANILHNGDYIHVQCKNLFCPASALAKKMQMHFIVLEVIYLFKDRTKTTPLHDIYAKSYIFSFFPWGKRSNTLLNFMHALHKEWCRHKKQLAWHSLTAKLQCHGQTEIWEKNSLGQRGMCTDSFTSMFLQ